MVVSEPLFQSSSQKATLVQGVVSDEEFDFIAMKSRMAVRVLLERNVKLTVSKPRKSPSYAKQCHA